MIWLKAPAAAREWAGGISAKQLYAAVRSGQLKAARIGAGRNLLFREDWVTDWLERTADRDVELDRAGLRCVERHAASTLRAGARNGDGHAAASKGLN